MKTAAATVAAPLALSSAVLGLEGRTSPNERINMLLIGCGGQGCGSSACAIPFRSIGPKRKSGSRTVTKTKTA